MMGCSYERGMSTCRGHLARTLAAAVAAREHDCMRDGPVQRELSAANLSASEPVRAQVIRKPGRGCVAWLVPVRRAGKAESPPASRWRLR